MIFVFVVVPNPFPVRPAQNDVRDGSTFTAEILKTGDKAPSDRAVQSLRHDLERPRDRDQPEREVRQGGPRRSRFHDDADHVLRLRLAAEAAVAAVEAENEGPQPLHLPLGIHVALDEDLLPVQRRDVRVRGRALPG